MCDAGPYEQVARVFRQHGYAREAEQILIAQSRHARGAITGRGAALRRRRHAAYGMVIGYGYRPARVLWLIAALLVLVAASLESPASQEAMRTTTSNGTVYTARGPVPLNAAQADRHGNSSSATAADVCGGGKVRCFTPVLYAIDTGIPPVSLDQDRPGTQTPTRAAGRSCNGGSTQQPCWAGCFPRSSSCPSHDSPARPDQLISALGQPRSLADHWQTQPMRQAMRSR